MPKKYLFLRKTRESVAQEQVYTTSGSARDVRLTVQRLNSSRQEQEPDAPQEEAETLIEQERQHASEEQDPHSRAAQSSWQDFVEVCMQQPIILKCQCIRSPGSICPQYPLSY